MLQFDFTDFQIISISLNVISNLLGMVSNLLFIYLILLQNIFHLFII